MKGYKQISIQNRGVYVVYKGEHYAVRNANTGRTTRMAKDEIICKFHLHHDALDRHITGGFKRCWCNANEDIVKVACSLNDVEGVTFLVTSLVVLTPQIIMILAVLFGYVDAHTLRPYVVPEIAASFAAMFGTSKGIADSYGFGFMQAIRSEMEKQAKALVLVTPKEVDDKVQELFPHARVTHTNVSCNEHAYNSGVNDGHNAMRTPAIS